MEREDFADFRAFEWDENKRRANVAKHGIDFVDAVEIFTDPRHFTFHSTRGGNERRYVSVGLSKGRIIAVVSTPREGNLRIISARAARKNETDEYEKKRKER
jgi:uncharacterized DUF497 family protein